MKARINTKWVNILIISFFLLCGISIFASYSYAKAPFKTQTINIEEEVCGSGAEYIMFTCKKKQILAYELDIKTISDDRACDDLDVKIAKYDSDKYEEFTTGYYDDDENFFEDLDVVLEENFSVPSDAGKTYSYWYYTDPGQELMPENYIIQLLLNSSDPLEDGDEYYGDLAKVKVSLRLYYFDGYANCFSIPDTLNLITDKLTAIKVNNVFPNDYLVKNDWKLSNNKKLEINYDPIQNNLELYPKKEGVCNIYYHGKKVSCAIIKNPPPRLNYKKFNFEAGYKDKIKLLYSKGRIKWKSTNKKVATVNKKGIIKAKHKGKCIIYCKYKGKKYSAKIKVKRGVPWFRGYLTRYNTRSNCFTVKYKNYNKKALTIYSYNAKAIDDDYKSFDRNLQIKGRNRVVIKPGKTKKIKFKVLGRVTWYDKEDYYIYFDFKYDGKRYRGRSWTDGTAYILKGKWRSTF